MNPQRVFFLIIVNFELWNKNVKSNLLDYKSNIWKLVHEVCGKNPLSPKVMHHNAKLRCIIHENLHNIALEKITNLKSIKEI